MVGHQVSTAFLAVLPLANLGLLEHADIVGSRRYPHCFRLPKTKGVHRAAGIAHVEASGKALAGVQTIAS